jgi:hypothetical protein
MVKVGSKVTRYQDIGIFYDSDFGFKTIARQRVYKNEQGTIQTPLTNLFFARQVTSDCKIPRAKDFEYRYVNACFENSSNDTGESNLKVILPYAPTDSTNHNGQIKEIAAYSGVLSVAYFGETHTSSIEKYLR